MIPYWLLFTVPAFAALQERSAHATLSRRKRLFGGAALLLTLMIGLRYQVGGDWHSYLDHLYRAEYLSFGEALTTGDPGYSLLNWLAARVGGDIWLVNLICGAVFATGLVSFARYQPRPWLAILVAIPYLVIVVAMGYSRQGVAIGLAMLSLVALARDRSRVKFVIWVALAATFHKSAALLIPLAALTAERGRIWTAAWIGAATILFYYLFIEDSLNRLSYTYLEREYQSEGAATRVAMNALPAGLFLLIRHRFPMTRGERRLWTNMALLALGFIVLLLLSPSSTAVDRMALYIIPLQIVVLSRLPDVLQSRKSREITLGVVAYSAAVQFVWLNFAGHAEAWVPYQIYPLL